MKATLGHYQDTPMTDLELQIARSAFIGIICGLVYKFMTVHYRAYSTTGKN